MPTLSGDEDGQLFCGTGYTLSLWNAPPVLAIEEVLPGTNDDSEEHRDLLLNGRRKRKRNCDDVQRRVTSFYRPFPLCYEIAAGAGHDASKQARIDRGNERTDEAPPGEPQTSLESLLCMRVFIRKVNNREREREGR